jgi:hypothetical protein
MSGIGTKMQITIHNILKDTNRSYSGDVATIERQLEMEFPWAVEHAHGDLDQVLYVIDHHPMYAVEVVDHSLHPFLKG